MTYECTYVICPDFAGPAQGVQLGGIAAVGLENQNAAWLALTERFYDKYKEKSK